MVTLLCGQIGMGVSKHLPGSFAQRQLCALAAEAEVPLCWFPFFFTYSTESSSLCLCLISVHTHNLHVPKGYRVYFMLCVLRYKLSKFKMRQKFETKVMPSPTRRNKQVA